MLGLLWKRVLIGRKVCEGHNFERCFYYWSMVNGKWLPIVNWKLIKLALSWRSSLSYRNKSIYLQSKSTDWFLYDSDLRHERVNYSKELIINSLVLIILYYNIHIMLPWNYNTNRNNMYENPLLYARLT